MENRRKYLFSFWGVNFEGSVWSLFSIFQIADDNAVSLFGLSLCQKADHKAVIVIGLSLFQKSDNKDASVIIGFSLFQKAGENAAIFAGFSFMQEAQNFQNGIFCIPFFQKKIEES